MITRNRFSLSCRTRAFILIILFCNLNLNATERREIPVYNEGSEDSISLKDIALFPFRVALYPAYLVTDYGIRRPIGALVTAAEKGKWYNHYVDFFSFFPYEHELGVFPNFFYEFGFRPTIGVHAYLRNFPNKKHLPELWVTTGGSDWTAFRFQDTYTIKRNDSKLIFNASKIDRPDLIFYGVGADTVKEAASRYSLGSNEVILTYEKLFFGESCVFLKAIYFNRELKDGKCCSDINISEAASKGLYSIPNGFNSKYKVFAPRIELELGQRLTRPEEWYGGRIMAFGQYNKRIDRSDGNWTHYGGSLVGFKRIDNRHRIFTLSLSASFVEKKGEIDIPFHELPANDGRDSFLGFKRRRIIGDSIISSSFEYKWPIWAYSDGILHYSVGNSFGSNLNGFDFGRLKQSIAFGLRQTASSGPQFNFLIGLGSNTFDQGGDFKEGRFVIGGGRAF